MLHYSKHYLERNLVSIVDEIISSSIISKRDPALVATVLKEIPDNKNLTLGYLALCEGNTTLGNIVEAATASKWSHVAMVLCDPKDIKTTESALKKTNKSKWLCFHSSVDQAGNGVQLIPWSTFEKVQDESNTASVALRPFMYYAPTPTNKKIQQVINPLIGLPYENTADLIKAPFRTNTSENKKSFFCSELTATVLKGLNIITNDPNSPHFRLDNNFVPADFSMECPHSFRLIGAELGNEINAWQTPSATCFRKAFECFTSCLRKAKCFS